MLQQVLLKHRAKHTTSRCSNRYYSNILPVHAPQTYHQYMLQQVLLKHTTSTCSNRYYSKHTTSTCSNRYYSKHTTSTCSNRYCSNILPVHVPTGTTQTYYQYMFQQVLLKTYYQHVPTGTTQTYHQYMFQQVLLKTYHQYMLQQVLLKHRAKHTLKYKEIDFFRLSTMLLFSPTLCNGFIFPILFTMVLCFVGER